MTPPRFFPPLAFKVLTAPSLVSGGSIHMLIRNARKQWSKTPQNIPKQRKTPETIIVQASSFIHQGFWDQKWAPARAAHNAITTREFLMTKPLVDKTRCLNYKCFGCFPLFWGVFGCFATHSSSRFFYEHGPDRTGNDEGPGHAPGECPCAMTRPCP